MHALRGATTALATSRSGMYPASSLPTNVSELVMRSLPQCRLYPTHHPDQIHRRAASSKARKEKKSERALVRARRVREESMASVIRGADWSAFNEGALKQGLRELDGPADSRKRGSYASKPLVSSTVEEFQREEGGENGLEKEKFMTQQEVWARDIQHAWNEILHADSVAGVPKASLPGFPIEVVHVVVSRDLGHIKMFWDIADHADPPPVMVKQIDKVVRKGFDPELVVLKSITQIVERRKGMLRTRFAVRYPMRRVPDMTWEHASRLELDKKW